MATRGGLDEAFVRWMASILGPRDVVSSRGIIVNAGRKVSSVTVGKLTLPRGPGLGITFDPAMLARAEAL